MNHDDASWWIIAMHHDETSKSNHDDSWWWWCIMSCTPAAAGGGYPHGEQSSAAAEVGGCPQRKDLTETLAGICPIVLGEARRQRHTMQAVVCQLMKACLGNTSNYLLAVFCWFTVILLDLIRSGMFPSSTRTHLLVKQEDMSSCRTRGHVFLFIKMICLPAKQEEMSSCSAGRLAFLLHKKNEQAGYRMQQETFLLVEQVGTSSYFSGNASCLIRGHVFLFDKRTCILLKMDTCLLIKYKTLSSCSKKDMSSCSTEGHVFLSRIYKLFAFPLMVTNCCKLQRIVSNCCYFCPQYYWGY